MARSQNEKGRNGNGNTEFSPANGCSSLAVGFPPELEWPSVDVKRILLLGVWPVVPWSCSDAGDGWGARGGQGAPSWFAGVGVPGSWTRFGPLAPVPFQLVLRTWH